MRKLLTSILTVFALISAGALGTQAVFSDTDSFEGNTISTAQVNIDARSEARGETLPKPLSATGLVPGEYTDWARGVVYNEADSSPVQVHMYVENLDGDACGATNIEVYTGHAADGADSERAFVVYSGPLTDLVGPANQQEITGPGKVFDPTLPVNTSAVIQQRAQLDETADNGLQNTSCTWDEVFVGATL